MRVSRYPRSCPSPGNPPAQPEASLPSPPSSVRLSFASMSPPPAGSTSSPSAPRLIGIGSSINSPPSTKPPHLQRFPRHPQSPRSLLQRERREPSPRRCSPCRLRLRGARSERVASKRLTGRSGGPRFPMSFRSGHRLWLRLAGGPSPATGQSLLTHSQSGEFPANVHHGPHSHVV
jgi:hypothetical protein